MKTVVLGITGSIAAYKACEIVSRLKKAGCNVRCILTKAGAEFITPLSLESLAQSPVVTDMFSRENPYEIEHISLARAADIFVIAPATANFLAKAAVGIADDMLSTTVLATKAPILIAPAMNDNMYDNVATVNNIAILKRRGAKFVEPEVGLLACGTVGRGRMAEPEQIVSRIMYELRGKTLFGKKILITAGATREMLDPVRFLSNRSTGKMGYSIAQAAVDMGAEVSLVSGISEEKTPFGVKRIGVLSTEEMKNACIIEAESADVVISAAAPCDFTPEAYSKNKIKKSDFDMMIKLRGTSDILKTLSEKYPGKILVGFAAETDRVAENAKKKLSDKKLFAIAANDISKANCGFISETNDITIYMENGKTFNSGLLTKYEVGKFLLERIFDVANEIDHK
ncbi:MAG: bifunctional phosphopantothenoylcysteine decarboxylase/phosphopantothenate--cysteine ligase CoaBC [Clostridia bacterium]